MTDVERLVIDYAAKASVYRESAEAYSASKSGEMRIAADAHKSLADDCAIIAAALREKAERESRTYQPCRDEERSDIEAAIAEIELDIKPLHPYSTKNLNLAIATLREKQEREKGCAKCAKDSIYIGFSFCPFCGRKLTGGKE